MDSIIIRSSFYDKASGKSILANNEGLNSNYYFVISASLLLISVGIYIRKKKKNITINDPPENQTIFFDPIEKILINLLKANLDNGVTIPEVNDLLGLNKKPLSIQKKNSNEVIVNINNKY